MNVFDLFARISLDSSEYEKSLDEAGKKSTSFIDKLGNGFATAAKAGAVAIGATSTAVGALAAQSVKAFSEFEQLEGGVQTLFKDSADQIMQYADAAYQTAGISANQYMETVTSFSASLIQSLGGDTQEAAEYANMAIIDMSDKMLVRVKRIELYQRCA